MDAHPHVNDPTAAQQLVAQYAELLEEHARTHAFPASTATLPAPKAAIKDAIGTVLHALAASGQLTGELTLFLEETFTSLANYVDGEMATLAAEHRRASEALASAPRNPRERLETDHWTTLARTSRLAGEIARASADEAETLRREFQALVATVT